MNPDIQANQTRQATRYASQQTSQSVLTTQATSRQAPQEGISLTVQGKPAKRNTVISICKGLAIILMVIGHAEAPDMLTRIIYTFHMPLFFITAGYFFSASSAEEPWRFCARRFKGLYIPFLKWSVFFLLLHNVLFYFGILNETYGNWTGGVTHPYTWRLAGARLLQMVTGMSGYDEFCWWPRCCLWCSTASSAATGASAMCRRRR